MENEQLETPTNSPEEQGLLQIPGCGFEVNSTAGEVPIERIIAVAMELARQKPGAKARFWIRIE